ncbi:MAG: hypothetical protein H0W66_03600 [Chthoniobacterales bacterium]|nr:hypothetical protein [Chthoniobacterales bacterium]
MISFELGEGLGFHIPKGYTYFAMAFAVFVELLNLKLRRRAEPVKLHNRSRDSSAGCAAGAGNGARK